MNWLEFQMINLDTARIKSEEFAKACLEGLVNLKPAQWLREGHLEEKNCWLFLKAKNLSYRPHCEEWSDKAFVISKKGKLMSIADHHENMERLKEYLKKISDYLEQRGE